jgi:hypothetical protein
MRSSHLLIIMVVALVGAAASAQIAPELIDLRQRLVDNTGAEYIAARDEALTLPHDSFADLLFLLRLSPEYSLEHILSIILEVRANHPEEAARFDRDFQHMLDNPDLFGRHGRPIYRTWVGHETKAARPFVFERWIKVSDVPPMPGGEFLGMAASVPDVDNVPYILYLAKHHSINNLAGLVTATSEHPEERAWLRPLALQMYKEYREQREVSDASGVIHMFRFFGAPEDLAILHHLRDYEQELLAQQGFTLADRETLHKPLREARAEYAKRKADLETAEREGAPATVIQQRQQQLDEIEPILLERQRQYHAKLLWDTLDEYIQRLEAQLDDAQVDP